MEETTHTEFELGRRLLVEVQAICSEMPASLLRKIYRSCGLPEDLDIELDGGRLTDRHLYNIRHRIQTYRSHRDRIGEVVVKSSNYYVVHAV